MGKLNRRKLCECNTCGLYVKPGNRYINGHSWKGKHPTEETLQKMRKPRSEETKQKLRRPRGPMSKEGRINIKIAMNKPEVKEKKAQTNARPEVKERKSKSLKIILNLPETKAKRAQTEARTEVKERKSQIRKKLWQDPEYREKQSQTNARPEVKERRSKSEKIAHNKQGVKEKQSQSQTKLWQDPIYRESQLLAMGKASCIFPNKFETFFINLFSAVYPQCGYTGNFTKIIAGKCPDFVDEEGKKIIELYGDYWHQDNNPQDRIDIFKKYGYDTLVIWEHELKDMNKLHVKLDEFIRR